MTDLNLSQCVEQFKSLISDLNYYNTQLATLVNSDSNLPYWFYEGNKEQLVEFIASLEHTTDEEAGTATTVFPALVGLPANAIEVVSKVNAARKAVSEFLRKCDKQYVEDNVLLVKYLLKQTALRRLNRKALARQFIELNERPSRVRFYWSTGRTIKKRTAEEAAIAVGKLIINSNDEEHRQALINEQNKLQALPADLIVAKVYSPKPQVRADYVINGQRINSNIAVLPVFYPAEIGSTLPELVPLPDEVTQSTRFERH